MFNELKSDIKVKVLVASLLVLFCNARNEEQVLEADLTALHQLELAVVRNPSDEFGVCHRYLLLHKIGTVRTTLDQKVILYARVIECYSDDLEESAGINLEENLHELVMSDQVQNLVYDVLPESHFVVAAGESFAE